MVERYLAKVDVASSTLVSRSISRFRGPARAGPVFSGEHDLLENSRERFTFTLLLFLIVAAVVLFSDKGHIGGDGEVRWKTLVTLMEEHRLTPDRYSIVQPLLAAPLYIAADAFWRLGHAGRDEPAGASRIEFIARVVQRFNKLVALALAAWLFVTLRRDFDLGLRAAALATLFLLFGSTLIPNARDFYSECLWTLLSAVALSLGTARRLPVVFVVATALAIALNPLLAPVLGAAFLLSGWSGAGRRLASLLLPAAGVGAGIALALLENVARRGRALDFGYAGVTFDAPFLVGLAGQVASPARGFLFYAPAFLLGFALLISGPLNRAEREIIVATLLFSGFLVLGYSKWHAWHGATYWGPRFLLPLSVFGALYMAVFARRALAAGSRRAIAFALAAGLLSCAVYKVGVAINLTHIMECLVPDPYNEACYWNWAYLPYASLLDRRDLSAMLLDRSTVVEPAGLLLALGLDRWAASRGWPLGDPAGSL